MPPSPYGGGTFTNPITSKYGGGTFKTPCDPAKGAAGPGAPFPQWTVNTTGWVLAHVTNASEKALAETATWPNKLIFFTSEQAARDYVNCKTGKAPVTSPASALGGQKALDIGTGAVDVLGHANLQSWFLRIGEILLGLVLVGVGIARITGVQNAISKIAKSKVPIPI